MATWKYAVFLGLMGAAVATGCVVKEGDGDDDIGEAGSGGTGGTTGGSSGKGGTGGSAGKGGTAGTGGSAGKGGTAGTGGTSAGSSGEGGSGASDETPECDPGTGGRLDNTPYPNCEPVEAGNSCEECIEQECCEESKECYSYAPGNVCGWGGPDGQEGGEIRCYQDCLEQAIEDNDDLCEPDLQDECLAECATPMCGLIGSATQDLAVCMHSNCSEECFGVTSCE